ncbi:MAG: stage IV sporulation protein A [Firmicutes bacterium]|nr:stage IV sporulation protein A [Bacillota bacterium]
MHSYDIYESMAQRTGGDLYIGVVGPVRSGKSTFIKRFMDLLVLPYVENAFTRDRIRDELPQSGTGRTITTTEPKFIPAEAAEIRLPGGLHCRVRMADCVGYMIRGAAGHLEEGAPRMVNTPWQPERIPFTEAAEMGTRKVMEDHSTIGIVVTTDGSIGEIPREDYAPAEERVIRELQELGKPFLVLLNSTDPEGEAAQALASEMQSFYQTPVLPVNCARMSSSVLEDILCQVLYAFPPSEIRFRLPGFLEGLSFDHWAKDLLIGNIRKWCDDFETLRDIQDTAKNLADGQVIAEASLENMDLGSGLAEVSMKEVPGLFYQIISEITGYEIKDDSRFFTLLTDLARAKKAYSKLEEAMAQVEEEGYGIVQPELSEMALEDPEIFRQGSRFGVRLRAKAPSLHIIRTAVTTEVAPVVGSEKQSEDLVQYLTSEFENDPAKIWETNIFGKSLYEMVTEQMECKLTNVPENVRYKVQRSLQKVADEGKEHMICFVL